MDQQTFNLKARDSDAMYLPYTGSGEYFELVDLISEFGQTPQVWVTVLDQSGQLATGLEVQNWYPNSESGRGEVFSVAYPFVEFNFGSGSRYSPDHSQPPNQIRVYNANTDTVAVGIPIEHWRWRMVFKRTGGSPPDPSGGVTEARVREMIDAALAKLRIVSQ